MTAIERYTAEHDRKAVYCGNRKYLRACKLCGNYYPLTADHFVRSSKPDLYGIRTNKLLLVCLQCMRDWGPERDADIAALVREAEANKACGVRRPIRPLALRKE